MKTDKGLFVLATFVLALLCAHLVVAASQVWADSGNVLRLRKIESPVVVDGHVEHVWNSADSTSSFIQFAPYHGKEPSRKTVAKLLATEHSLFCLILCEEDEKNIQRNTGVLDDFGGDLVSLMIDTFCDKRTAYKFAVSASGVRADCRLLDDARNRDYSWDGVWFSATKIYDWGFVVEMEIPYRSILYDEGLSEWGLDVDRWIPTLNEDIYWCKYEENEGLRVSKFGKLVFEDSYPSVKGLNLEIYPVGILKAEYLDDSKYELSPSAGIDVSYNPSQRLTFQLTGNPDFAQIEADPFDFNITRYESYFDERRPFFTEGNEVFMPSGRERSSGFYRPLELFYSRRIGKKLPDGGEVPLLLGTKAVGRVGQWEYGGFLAMTGEKDYVYDGEDLTESQALFSSVRVKKQILENSSIGLLYVGKSSEHENTGVIDIDGAFRSADWQLSYQVARSYKDSEGDFAASAGLMMPKEKWMGAVRGRYIGEDFDANQVGFVPWKGTAELTALIGPRWYFEEGYVKQILLYTGGVLDYEKLDAFTDRIGVAGINMQFRNNWGYEVSFLTGRAKELEREFTLYEVDFSGWVHISPKWNGSLSGALVRSYNFSRDYLAYFTWMESEVDWHALDILDVGTSLGFFTEWNPDNRIEDITVNMRPFLSLTPVNDLSVRVYLDNVYLRSTGQIQQLIGGLLFSYNFRPKSWIYLAINEVHDRSPEYDSLGGLLPNRLHVTERASVIKLKYLFYF
jgi:hypothetical protein